MASLIPSPKGGQSTAAKLKGFGHALNRSLGIAKRWTLEKVGAKEQSQEPPELTAIVAAFHADKADLEELRAKVAHLITTEKVLLDADLAFAQSLDDLHIPKLSTVDIPADNQAVSATSAAPAAEAPATAPAAVSATPPPFNPQIFSAYLSKLHHTHHAYLTALSTTLLDPIDQLLDNDVSILNTISRQLPLLRLDHHAKADALHAIERREDKRGLEEAQKDERESREVWEAQMEVVDKLGREVAIKKAETLRLVAEGYVRESRLWYEAMARVAEQAVRERETGGVDELQREKLTVGEKLEAAVDKTTDALANVGEHIVNAALPDAKQ